MLFKSYTFLLLLASVSIDSRAFFFHRRKYPTRLMTQIYYTHGILRQKVLGRKPSTSDQESWILWSRWLSTCGLRPSLDWLTLSQWSHIRYPACKTFTIQSTSAAKLYSWSRNECLGVTIIWWIVLQGIRKIENCYFRG